jgi:hypothetical protein
MKNVRTKNRETDMPTIPEGKTVLVVHIRKDLHLNFKMWCVKNKKTIQSVIEELIEKKIK